jgi:predicted methyltransferase
LQAWQGTIMNCVISLVLGLTLALPTGAALARSSEKSAAQPDAVAPSAAASNAAIATAIASPDRPADDREQDARRKPAELLGVLGVGAGMHVLDAFSASGYYTELLSRTVGPTGEVIAYNNGAYARFAAKGIETRYANDRLPNVRQVTEEVDKLSLPAGSLDAALFVMSYHDLYWRPADGSWPATDPIQMLTTVRDALKPGGVVVVQDHVARPGGDAIATVDALHRIDPALVRRDFESAGFVFDGDSPMLAHPDDDHTKLVFDPSIRGKTDQFVYRFRKPAK